MTVPSYCPHCGSALSTKVEGGRERPACTTEGCGFFHFTSVSIGCGGVVISEGKALLIQRGHNPGRGSWQIPGGYVEDDEEIHAAIEREVLEEAGVVAQVRDVVGFRHSASRPDRPIPNLYVVFRLDPLAGEPQHDGDETLDAGYFSVDEMEGLLGIQNLSLWAVRMALGVEPAGGLISHHESFDLRPGWSIFGVPPHLS